jgi:hypothetical protein
MASAGGLGNHPTYMKNTALAGTFASGDFVSLWTAIGQPGAGAAPAATPGAVPLSTTAGAIPFNNPAAGNSYLAKFFATSPVPGVLMLYDRLVGVGALSATIATLQTIASAALTRPDANGVNAEVWIEATTAIGTTASNLTITYTDNLGNTGHVSPATPMVVSKPIGWAMQVPLAAGDAGIRSVTGVQLSAGMTTGAFNVVLARRVATFPIPAAFVPYPPQDPVWAGISQIYNSACLFGIYYIGTGTAAPTVQCGELIIAQG